MHSVHELMNELRRAQAAAAEYANKVADLNTVIANITEELEKYPTLSDRVAVEISDDMVTFLTSEEMFSLTRDEIQILVELLGGAEESEQADEAEVPDPPSDSSRAPSFSNKEDTHAFVDHLEAVAIEKMSGSVGWYYRVLDADTRRKTFSTQKTWQLRQFLRRKAQLKNAQKLVVQIVQTHPNRPLMARTGVFGVNA
jgi:DNA-directed RNA polymerase subunit F